MGNKAKFTHEQLRELLDKGYSNKMAADEFGVNIRTVERKRAQLKASGFDPENQRSHKNPKEQPVAGYSTLVRFPEDDPLGRVLEWVKTKAKVSDQLEALNRIVESLSKEVTPVEAVKYLGNVRPSKSKFTVIPMGDPHIGLMTWKNEVGQDWDLTIAQRVYKNVFSRLLAECRDTEECVLINTGDYFHTDNIDGVTNRSRHKLDLDGRHGKWLDVGGALLMMFIDACLKKFKKVTFVNVPGNHDDILGRFLGTLSAQAYRNESRLTVLKGDAPRQYLQRGIVGMGFAHSHLCRPKQLPQAFAMDVPQIWGATRLRMFFTGHVHHDSETVYKDNNGVTVVTAGIIPPADAHSHGAGYGANRTMQAYTLDADRGELVSRATVTVRADD